MSEPVVFARRIRDGFVPFQTPRLVGVRRDPLVDEIDIDTLYNAYHAFEIMKGRYGSTPENFARDWKLPNIPMGRLAYEEIYQFMVFAIPMFMLLAAAFFFELSTNKGQILFLNVALAAGAVFYALHKMLDYAIRIKYAKEWKSDERNLYFYFKYVSSSLCLKAEELTLQRFVRMALDFAYHRDKAWRDWNSRFSDEAMKRAAAQNAARFDKSRSYDNRVAPAQQASEQYYDNDNNFMDDDDYPEYSSPYASVNPTTGEIMVDDVMDAGGHVYGTMD